MVDGILRRMADADPRTAREGWNEFGAVYFEDLIVTAEVVALIPGLAELAGVRRLHQRHLFPHVLGDLANPGMSRGPHQPAARAAVLAQAGTLVPLLDDPHSGVRAAAAYVLSQCGPGMAGVLRARWDLERDSGVRANLLGALAELGQVDLLRAAAVEKSGPVPAAAAVAYARKGWDLPPEAVVAIAASLGRDDHYLSPWVKEDPTTYVLRRLGDESADALAAALAGGTAKAKIQLCRALMRRFLDSRRAPALLMPRLRRLLSDPNPEVVGWVSSPLDVAGEAASAVADDLLGLAHRGERWAARDLIAVGDPRWHSLPDVWEHHGTLQVYPPAFSPDGLDAVRRRIAEPPPDKEKIDILAAVLEPWGEQAAPAVPELVAALPVAPWTVSRVLGAIGPAARAAVPDLRALDGVGPAHAVWRITGDPGPLIAAGADVQLIKVFFLRPELSNHLHLRRVADAGPAARPLLPRYLPALTDDTMDIEIRLSVAALAWHATGDPALVRPVIERALALPPRDIFSDRPLAVDLAARLEPTATSFVPLLWTLLGEMPSAVGAARALLRYGADPAELIDPLVALATAGRPDAVELLVELGATAARPALAELAERDERQLLPVPDDEAVRRALRAAVIALS